ncbi:MAG: UDP-N-acetylglucosamine 1-carboxyvinyltransferase [candidate division Zixibacteria bacterium]|nr:UDP-N-acetylglucosamine 1-carboxyvinyltransferase [candidate division Zixibacteria bacterium]
MDKFIINGGHKLNGEITLQGSKNAALPILAAGLLFSKGQTIIKNVPNLADIDTMIQVLNHLGVKTTWDKKTHSVTMDASNIATGEAPYDLVRKMRASFLVMGPLLGRTGRAKVSLPGGCVLGPRPVDYHLKAFTKLGAVIEEEQGYVNATAKNGLKGTIIHFDKPSHTGTENVIMAACFAQGTTTIINAGCDPEVVDLADFLNKGGAKIRGAGSVVVQIEGVKELKPVEHTVMPDRLEAGTFMMAVGAAGGQIKIRPNPGEFMSIVIEKLTESGLEISPENGALKISRHGELKAINITTFPYPGFPTDLQASALAMSCLCEGISHIKETVFTERFTHVMELTRLGADIKVAGEEAIITGVKGLQGASVMASDIRAGAGLIVGALGASGTTEILRVYHIDRGYEKIEDKLTQLGADIKRMGA